MWVYLQRDGKSTNTSCLGHIVWHVNPPSRSAPSEESEFETAGDRVQSHLREGADRQTAGAHVHWGPPMGGELSASIQSFPAQWWCNVMNIAAGCLLSGRRSTQHLLFLSITATLQHLTEGKKNITIGKKNIFILISRCNMVCTFIQKSRILLMLDDLL